jgi:hypothetical protein
MTILPLSPFLDPSDDAHPPGAPPECGPATPDDDISDVHEIFHFARQLIAEDRQPEIDRIGLLAVAQEIEAWISDVDPLPMFLRQEAAHATAHATR